MRAVCRTLLCGIALDYVGPSELKVIRLIGQRSTHLNRDAIEERTSLPAIVESQ
jgi:hypothetical protein